MNEKFIDIIISHIQNHPQAEVVDIYKLLYQVANGPRHLFAAGMDFDELFRQWESAENFGEPAFEKISADGRLVRAHFAPLKKMGIPFEVVRNALIITAESYRPKPELLIEWWRELGELINIKVIPLSKAQYEALDEEFQQWGFVAKHHSEIFKKTYKPAYIVSLTELYDKNPDE